MPSIRESILANVKSTMQAIAPGGTPAAGYSTPVKQVFRWGIDTLPAMIEAPLIFVIDAGDVFEQMTLSLLHSKMTVVLEGWQKIVFENDDAVAQDASAFLADVLKAIVQNNTRGGFAINTKVKGQETVLQREADPFYVVTVTVEIEYRTNLTNPASQTP